jgi:asparagine synthase (glutamine-hydrolysing)
VSGIAAVLNLDGSPVAQWEVERMANVLKPHGPDRQKIVRHRNAAFAFCLQRVTPEDLFDRQPIFIANRCVMLFDGRIDNREELSGALGIAASDMRSTPDSMIAYHLFDRFGEQGVEQILGDFAIITLDLRTGALICARDHMGMRVLHYHYASEKFAVASVPEALFALSWVPRTLNKDKIGDTLARRGLNGETTYYKEIYRVLPGSLIRVSGSSFSKVRFWDPERIADVRFKSDQDYVDSFRERLENAVKVRLRSTRPPCATITGGLDSSSIAMIAADLLAAGGDKLNTFTAVPETGFVMEDQSGLYFDEMPYVHEIAKTNTNIVPHFVQPNKGPILERIDQQIRIGGFSAGILNGLWVMDILDEARSSGHNVMLNGDMGNITMSYHGRQLFTQLLLTGRWLRLLREIRSSYRPSARIRQYLIAPLIPELLFRRYKKWRRGGKPPWYDFSALNLEFAAKSGIVDRAAREYMPFDKPPVRDARLSRINDFHCYCEAADWFAKIRASFGIDCRIPSFDRRLVEFCVGIPEEQFLRGGNERWLIKRAMRGRLPDIMLNNNKRGAQAADWYLRLTRERTLIAKEVKRLTTNPEVSSMIDMQRLIAILGDWPDRQPAEWSPEQQHLRTLPDSLGAAYFIENVVGTNS